MIVHPKYKRGNRSVGEDTGALKPEKKDFLFENISKEFALQAAEDVELIAMRLHQAAKIEHPTCILIEHPFQGFSGVTWAAGSPHMQ